MTDHEEPDGGGRDGDHEPPEERIYLRAMEQLIEQATAYMGHERAVEIANSVPIRVDNDGEIREVEFGETVESKRAVTRLLLEAYVQVVGRQLVINMLQVSVSGQQLRTLESLCPSDGAAGERSVIT